MRYSKPVGKTKEKASVTAVPGRQVLVYGISLITDDIFLLRGAQFFASSVIH
jgi:hypothetical protein